MGNRLVKLDSIEAYNRLYGLSGGHPLVSVVDLKQATVAVNHVRVDYGVYALFLKNDVNCTLKYGRRSYDCQEGTVVCFSPGQVIDVDMEVTRLAPDVKGLLFHPDIMFGSPLAAKMPSFSFFNYSQLEALHLSEAERATFLECLGRIREETEQPVDAHSGSVLAANIQLLLEYMHRFYDRQFVTRHKVNSDVVAQFERELRGYYNRRQREGIPGVAYFAERASLSPGYFGGLIRKETGSSAKELITNHMVSVAKNRLASGNEDVSLIAYDLGFEYPAHFSRMFKRATGQTPSEYRAAMRS